MLGKASKYKLYGGGGMKSKLSNRNDIKAEIPEIKWNLFHYHSWVRQTTWTIKFCIFNVSIIEIYNVMMIHLDGV